ncbi:spore germination protein [Desulfofalx alkaliphila]|uniref:spore germination protein n=1 Tax=Desulfofalx alkaliphila TaxID=105483 RepID=UPI000B0D787C|nr:spore germination protein [Desulfofalx alkaliphila]
MILQLYKRLKEKLTQLKPQNLFPEKGQEQLLSTSVDKNLAQLKQIFRCCSDIVLREIKINAPKPIKAVLVFVDGLVDEDKLSEHIMEALQVGTLNKANVFEAIEARIIGVAEINTTSYMNELVDYVMAGDVAIVIDGCNKAIVPDVRGWADRGVEEPSTETLVRGPRDGFNETIRTNTALIRRRIRTPRLKMEALQVGRLTKTDVVVAYVAGIADDNLVKEVKERIQRIDIDTLVSNGPLEELIEDNPYSFFPQADTTERPDKTATRLLEGYVAILVDTSPMVLIVPITFPEFLKSPEDYYNRYPYASFTRLLRFFSSTIALLLPSLYIAVVTFHQEMLPTPLLISIANQREGVPFPAFVEALMMEIVFEILREAGVRMPRPVGQAVSIVGALVIGDAAVNAGLVSPAMVMVVALTAIASFTIPTISGSYPIRLLRFPIMFMAAMLGLFGIMIAFMALIFHLCSLRSFGMPYLYPMSPVNYHDLKDTYVRVPWWAKITRPHLIGDKNFQRQKIGQMPGPHQGTQGRRRGDKDNA